MIRALKELGSTAPPEPNGCWRLLLCFLLVAAPLLTRAATLHEAASQGDLVAVQRLLSSNPAAINTANSNGDTALHFAAARGQFAAAQLLVASNAAVNVTNRAGVTPLELASCTRHMETVSTNGLQTFLTEMARVGVELAGIQSSPASLGESRAKKLDRWKRWFSGTEDPDDVASAKRQIVELLLAHGARLTNESGFPMALHNAASNPDGKILRLLLQHGANPKGAHTALEPVQLAAVAGNRDGVSALLEAGADVNAAGKTGMRPLFCACGIGDEQMVALLLKAGADVDAPGSGGVRPLLSACVDGNEPLVRLLLQAGADVEAASDAGKRPLHGALEAGSEPIVVLLLEKGASATKPDDRKITPLHVAANNGSEKLIALLLGKGAEIDAKDDEGFTPMLNAVERGNLKAVELLVSRGADPLATCKSDRRGALHIAATDNRLELMQWALNHGCNVDSRDKDGMTPQHYAAVQGHPGATALLLRNNANPRSMNHKLGTPLHEAARGTLVNRLMAEQAKTNASPRALPPFGSPADYVATAALLITNGSPIEAENSDLATPLHLAAAGPVELVKFFLEQGAQVNARTLKRLTPLMIAARGGSAEAAEALLAHGAQIDAVQPDGQNALLWAAAEGNARVLEILLRHNADIRSRNALRATALHLTAVGGHQQTAAALVHAGAEINASDNYGQTPLHIAVVSRKPRIVELLVAHGADVRLTDRNGATPLDTAKAQGSFDIISLLESRPQKPD